MSVKIQSIKEADQRRVTMLIWGEAKIGKTSLVKTLPVSDPRKVLYIGADAGQLVLRNHDFSMATPDDGVWSIAYLTELADYLRLHGSEYEAVCVDGLDELGELVLAEKMKTISHGLKAYGEMSDFMAVWTKSLRDIQSVSVIFITHLDKDKDDVGRMMFAPAFPGKKMAEKLIDWFDLCLAMRIVPQTDKNSLRLLQCKAEGDARFLVGDRSGALNEFEPPDIGAIFGKIFASGYKPPEPKAPEPERPATKQEALMDTLVKRSDRIGMTTAGLWKALWAKRYGAGAKPSKVSALEPEMADEWTTELDKLDDDGLKTFIGVPV